MMDFEWTDTRTKAAELLAAKNLTQEEIADCIGVHRRTLWEWRQVPEFAARVDAIVEQNRAETRRIGIADKERRLAALNDRWSRLRRIIEERAEDPEIAKGPGGSTGLMVRQLKSVGSGDSAIIVEEYAIDAALLKELRELEKHASIELGQWDEAPTKTAEKAKTVMVVKGVSMDEI